MFNIGPLGLIFSLGLLWYACMNDSISLAFFAIILMIIAAAIADA
jgi:hypothetical protein